MNKKELKDILKIKQKFVDLDFVLRGIFNIYKKSKINKKFGKAMILLEGGYAEGKDFLIKEEQKYVEKVSDRV